MTSKTDSVAEIQVSDIATSTEIEDNDSMRWRSVSEIASTSEDSGTCDTDKTEWLGDNFYKQSHIISNLEYAKLKLSSFVLKLHDIKPIIALINTVATCSCISYHLFMKIPSKVDRIQKTLWVNTDSGTTLGLKDIVPLITNIEEHSFKHKFSICMKLKQPLIIGLNFSQRYKLGVDWDTSGTLYLQCEWWKITNVIRKGNLQRQVMTICETALAEKKK